MHDEDEQVECDDDDEEKYDDNEVNDEKGDTVSSSHIDGGGNAPEVALEFKSNDDFIENESGLELKSNDDLIEALIEIERRGMKIPKTQEERIELITKHHLFGHFGRDAVCKSLIRDGYWWRGMRKQITKELSIVMLVLDLLWYVKVTIHRVQLLLRHLGIIYKLIQVCICQLLQVVTKCYW